MARAASPASKRYSAASRRRRRSSVDVVGSGHHAGEIGEVGRGVGGSAHAGAPGRLVEGRGDLGVRPFRGEGEVPGSLLRVARQRREPSVERAPLARRGVQVDGRPQQGVREPHAATRPLDDAGLLRPDRDSSVRSLDPAISSTSSQVGWDVAAIASNGSCAAAGNAASRAERSFCRSSGTAQTPSGSTRAIVGGGPGHLDREQRVAAGDAVEPGHVRVGESVARSLAQDPSERLDGQRADARGASVRGIARSRSTGSPGEPDRA